MFILSRKQLLFTAISALVCEILATGAVLLVRDYTGQYLFFWGFLSLIFFISGWLSAHFTGNWFVAILVPLLVYIPFTLVTMAETIFFAYTPLYLATSLGGHFFYKYIKSRKKKQ